MSFVKTTILNTKESCSDQKVLGQIVVVPSGTLDKVSLFLEPTITDQTVAENAMVVVQAFGLDNFGFPTGVPLASDSRTLASITVSGYVNFRLSTVTQSSVAVILRMVGGDANNYVSWRFFDTSSSGQEVLLSSDGGSTWLQDPTRKFTYAAFSFATDVISRTDQTAKIAPGTLKTITDDSNYDFSQGTLDRLKVSGDTVVIDFSNLVITLVVDQSGSMTWNDNGSLRLDFLRQFISDIDSRVPVGSTAKYSIVKFRGRRIGSLTIEIEGADQKGFDFQGVQVIRSVFPIIHAADIGSGTTVYEGIGQSYVDLGVPSGTQYYYSIFSRSPEITGPYSLVDSTTTPSETTKAPMGVAAFSAVPEVVLDGGIDMGRRNVNLSWLHPSNYDYSTITIVRRNDRMPTNPYDIYPQDINGNVVFTSSLPTLPTSFVDTFDYSTSNLTFINGLTYYYGIFTSNAAGIKCYNINGRTAAALIQTIDRTWETTESGVPPSWIMPNPISPVLQNVLAGDGEVQIDWTQVAYSLNPPTNAGLTRSYKLWFREDGYPSQSDAYGREFDGQLLFNGTTNEFIHRRLDNDQPYFYLLVSVDTAGNVSLPVTFKAVPSSTSVIVIPPEQVSGFSADLFSPTSNSLSWINPTLGDSSGQFYFGDQVRVLSTVNYADAGDVNQFVKFEFVEDSRSITEFGGATNLDPQTVLSLATATALGSDSISCVAQMTNNITVLNQIQSANISLHAVLRITNGLGNVISEVSTAPVTVTFLNPFNLSLTSDPPSQVSRRTWGPVPGGADENGCTISQYTDSSFPGVYVMSKNEFFGVANATFRGAALTTSANVILSILDKATGLPTNLISFPGLAADGTVSLPIQTEQDEILDRNGEQTGIFMSVSSASFTLPSSDVPGDLILSVSSTYRGYTQTSTMEMHYEPILNVDLSLTPFIPDGVDAESQEAFVYLAPFDAPPEQKQPVADFTITEWSITSLCPGLPPRPLYGGDVPGLGVRAYTRGGIAGAGDAAGKGAVLWGPGFNVKPEEVWQVSVEVQANGMTGVGFGLLTFANADAVNNNRIFLRKQGGFDRDEIYADGLTDSTWEVLGDPEVDGNISDQSSGKFFVQAVENYGGQVATLEEGRAVVLNVGGNSQTPNLQMRTFSASGWTNWVSASSALANVNGGKAVFGIRIDAKVPNPPELAAENQQDLQPNLIYGVQFDKPNAGLFLTLAAYANIEINGKAVGFKGGGGDLISDAPPTFIALDEPLEAAR